VIVKYEEKVCTQKPVNELSLSTCTILILSFIVSVHYNVFVWSISL